VIETPRYLGRLPHPSVGIRIPEVLLEGILNAYKKHRVAGGLELSYNRETAPKWVINAPPGVYEITRGHTGTSIESYLTLGATFAKRKGVIVEMEADHLSVDISSAQAVKRISGYKEEVKLTEKDIKLAIDYVKSEIEEAIATGYINFFTLDTCGLIDTSVEKLKESELEKRFYEEFNKTGADKLITRYVQRNYSFIGSSGQLFRVSIPKRRLMQIALKFKASLDITFKMVNYLRSKMNKPFGIEIAFDETPYVTREDELLFYLSELHVKGIKPDFIAPNVGFEKKMDYIGDLNQLKRRVEMLSAIAMSYDAFLSFHSGSGSNPWSGKGPGVYEVLLAATGGNLKYKISGIYIELLMELLSSYPKGSRQRNLYEEIFNEVYRYVKGEVEKRGPLDSPALRRQLAEYEKKFKKANPYNPRIPLFRYYSFIALNLRDKAGRRYLREGIVDLYENDNNFRAKVDKEVEALTSRLINGLKFTNNIIKLK